MGGKEGMTVYDVVRDRVRPPLLAAEHLATRPWERPYVATVVILDALAALAAGAAAYAVRFGDSGSARESVLYGALSTALPLLWALSMALGRAYEPRYLGVGFEEFRRVLLSAAALVAAVATFSYATAAEIARGYVVLALPLATVLTLIGRYAARKRLHRMRSQGECMHRVVAVGHERAVIQLVEQVRREPYHGIQVVGACLPSSPQHDRLRALGVPVVGGFDDVPEALTLSSGDTVAVLACPEMDGPALRRLAWSLEPTGADLVVAPGLIEVAGPRLTIRPVSGLPLLHVERPRLSGASRVIKGFVDRAVSLLALVLLLPVFLGIAILIRLNDEGAAFFRQTRVGLNGREFTVYKFRTMVVDAEQRRAALLSSNVHGDGVLFKLHSDPRVTRIGALLRRFSIDELPQLLNVVLGQMSLVGPRPPLPQEVAKYGDDVWRRMLVKPGLTGLWQVSGRSNLSWEESVRLDLRYVENWSLALDALILWKTGSAVVRGAGAY